MFPYGFTDADGLWRLAMDRYVEITSRFRVKDRRLKAWEKRADAFATLTRETKEDLRIEAYRRGVVDSNGPTTRPERRAKGWLY